MIYFLYLVCGVAAAYQLVALLAVVRHLLSRERGITRFPKVSILKPVHGRDPFFEEAIGSHMHLDYPDYEVLFCVADANDEAAPAVRQLQGAQLHVTAIRTPNAKVASMIELSRHAQGEVLVVNDGDIRVTPDYLRRVVAGLEDPAVGMVTCLYRPIPEGISAAWEAIGIATDFAPSTLVAPLVGINEFGLGSTLCFRAADLRAIGGFASVAEYIADDYQLASRITRQLGKRALMSPLVVDTNIGYRDWAGAWRHQVRWARTIRVSRGDGYLGLPVTQAGFWALVALLCGAPQVALGLAAVRMLTGFVAGYLLLRAPVALLLPLIPLWDVTAFCIWIAGLSGNTVEWRGRGRGWRRMGGLWLAGRGWRLAASSDQRSAISGQLLVSCFRIAEAYQQTVEEGQAATRVLCRRRNSASEFWRIAASSGQLLVSCYQRPRASSEVCRRRNSASQA